MPPFKDRTGEKHGPYTVVAHAGKKNNVHHWTIVCENGHQRDVSVARFPSGDLRICKKCCGDLDRIAARFWPKVNKTKTCWLWTGSKQSMGYGQFSLMMTPRLAHQVSWWLTYGKWPEHQLDHKCRTPLCVNPDHLDDVPQRENFLRGMHPNAIKYRKNQEKRANGKKKIKVKR